MFYVVLLPYYGISVRTIAKQYFMVPDWYELSSIFGEMLRGLLDTAQFGI